MIGIRVVTQCPHTQAATGIMHINHKVLGIIAGAVWDQNEWMAFLIGTRSPDGLQVMVTDLRAPYQIRGHGNCETVTEEPLAADVVGVIHSHHSMGAFFSETDNTKLNPRFPTSIVVSQPKYGAPSEHTLLGFSYKAEGKIVLSCGTPGIINFIVQPMPMVEDWPVVEAATRGTVKPGPLFGCPHTTQVVNSIYQTTNAKCGLTTTEPMKAYFGRDSVAFIAEVEKQTKAIVQEYAGYQYVDNRHHKGKLAPFSGGPWDDDSWIRHWSAYGGD